MRVVPETQTRLLVAFRVRLHVWAGIGHTLPCKAAGTRSCSSGKHVYKGRLTNQPSGAHHHPGSLACWSVLQERRRELFLNKAGLLRKEAPPWTCTWLCSGALLPRLSKAGQCPLKVKAHIHTNIHGQIVRSTSSLRLLRSLSQSFLF